MTDKKNKLYIHLKSALARITLTPHTLAFLLLSVIHCVAQGLTIGFLYSEDSSSFEFVDSITRTAQVPKNEVSRLFRSGDHLELKICTSAPIGTVFKDCETIWSTDMDVNGDSNASNETLVARFLSEVEEPSTSLYRRASDDASLTAVRDPETGVVQGVELTFDNGREDVVLSRTCARMLGYPQRIIGNSRREDLALIGSQLWLLGISTFGILYNSIPHIWAVVFARVMQTVWASYTLWRTSDFKFRYDTLIVGENTPCHFDILPMYFNTRAALQIPDLVLNVTALISTSFLAWHILKGYKVSTIRRVGPPPGVMRLYRFFLIDSMFLQLSLFFTVTATSLWLDQLMNSEIATLSQRSPVYYSLIIFTMVTIIPWMIMGWFSVRRELKYLMGAFLFINLVYIVCWGTMFYSQVYLWTFIEWPFFASTTIVSFFVIVGAGVVGIICWTGFDKGLAHYLHVEQVLLESDFDSDMFANDTEKGPGSGGFSPVERSPSAFSQLSGVSDISVVKKDANWDFADVDRPAIYTIDMKSRNKGGR